MNKTLLKLTSNSFFLLLAMSTQVNASCEVLSKRDIASGPDSSQVPCYISGSFTTGSAANNGRVVSNIGCNYQVTRIAADNGSATRNLYSVRFNQPFCNSVSVVVFGSKSSLTVPGFIPAQPLIKSVSTCGFIVAADVNSTVEFFATPTT